MRTHPAVLVVLSIMACGCTERPTTPSASTPGTGSTTGNLTPKIATGLAKWAEGYPRAIPIPKGQNQGTVEILGTFDGPAGVQVKSAYLKYNSGDGGRQSTVEIQYQNGHWGKVNPQDPTKILPAQVPLSPGDWQMWVWLVLESPDANGITIQSQYSTRMAVVEVK